MATPQQTRVLLGEAGEHLVVSRLLGLGYVAGQLPRTYRSDDVYVECADQRIVHFQVKTTQLETNNWPVHRVEDEPTRFFAFVNLFERLSPVVYVVPSATVRHALELHAKLYFLDHPPEIKPGVPAIRDPFRSPRIATEGYPKGWLEQYREAWNLLPPTT